MSDPDRKTSNAFQEKLAGRAKPTRKLRVLAVDDEPSILELLKTALTAFDSFEVSIANSGVAALKLIDRQNDPFDCILLDIQMPQMNGITLCEEVRRCPEYEDTPIIMLTAMSDRKYVDQAFLAGATDYVTKPFDFLELRSRMAAAQRIVKEHKRASDSAETARKLQQELAANQQFNLDDPVTIEGVGRLLRYAEFDNYIMQLSQGRLFNTYATAYKLHHAEQHHARMSSADFRRTLKDVANGISEVTKKTGDILSYRGNGVFLSIVHGRAQAQDLPDEIMLNQLVETLQAQRQANTTVGIVMGERVPMRSLSKSGALMSLYKAIESVEAKEAVSEELKTVSSRVLNGQVGGREQAQVNRRAFESVLRDLFREEPSLRSH